MASLPGGLTRSDDVGPLAGTVYGYRLRAVTTGGTSAWSNVVEVPVAEVDESNRWSTLGGDAAHTGYNPLETGHPPLTRAWSATAPPVVVPHPVPLVTDGRRVFIPFGGADDSERGVVALDPETGGILWRSSLGPVVVGQPAVFDGLVYVTSCIPRYPSNASASKLWALDAVTGGVAFTAHEDCQVLSGAQPPVAAPIVVDGTVFTAGGGDLYGFDATTGAQRLNQRLIGSEWWMPASDGTAVYSALGYLVAHELTRGSEQWSLSVANYGSGRVPVVAGGLLYVLEGATLLAVDVMSHEVRWRAIGSSGVDPAVASGIVYLPRGPRIQALDARTGAELWTFDGDGDLFTPVVTRTHLYAASASTLYAVDLTTHQQVWTAPGGGVLAIAGGRLYVVGMSGEVTARALTP